MFASNQVLSISGQLTEKSLYNALAFAINVSGNMQSFIEKNTQCVYQITDDEKYCIGWAYGAIPSGWEKFEFEFSLKDITNSIMDYLIPQKLEEDIWDGLYRKGFLMEAIPESISDISDGVKSPFYGIVSFKAFTCFYSK